MKRLQYIYRTLPAQQLSTSDERARPTQLLSSSAQGRLGARPFRTGGSFVARAAAHHRTCPRISINLKYSLVLLPALRNSVHASVVPFNLARPLQLPLARSHSVSPIDSARKRYLRGRAAAPTFQTSGRAACSSVQLCTSFQGWVFGAGRELTKLRLDMRRAAVSTEYE